MILSRILSRLILFLVLTVVIEAVFAFVFGVRNLFGQAIVLLVNFATNPLITSITTAVSFYISPKAYYYFLVPLEILVVIVEGLVYKKALKIKMNPFLLSFLLNACSFFIGSGIYKIINILR